MKHFLSIFSLLIFANAYAGDLTIDDIKKKYKLAIHISTEAKQLDKTLSNQKHKSNLMLAYYGSNKGLLAKHAALPYNKLSYLNECLKIIDEAVSKEPNNIEIRYIRFTIQSQTPEFLGKSKDFLTDKYYLISALEKTKITNANKNLTEEIAKFLLEFGKCSDKEKTSLTTVLKNCKTL